MSQLGRLTTGIMEVDLQMADGLYRGGLGIVLGGSGDGKSMFLIHQAAHGVREGLHVGLITLELPRPIQSARYMANVVGMPFNDILGDDRYRMLAERRMTALGSRIGNLRIHEMPPYATTVADVSRWCDRCADADGKPFDLLVIDYADKMHHPGVRHDNQYEVMGKVYEGLRRDVAVDKNMYVWTGSQAGRPGKEKQKRLDLGNVADSMNKVRVSDVVLTLNAQDDGTQMLIFVAKNRLGRSRFQVGPFPTDFAQARMTSLPSELADWYALGLGNV